MDLPPGVNVPTYPLPYYEGDQRLSFALLVDVRTAVLRHGFPELTRVDMETLYVSLRLFLYGEMGRVPLDPPVNSPTTQLPIC
ncbi:hypothetical protein GCM10011608_27990 [Micromonospora sonchi]|uniref:Uncharacterized protein n=1 Tax=Micromonospora sonchi TaxID=1763543 RepID=A0A917TWY8_9ACTN|nr:hypothetical protein GCM10011608_27990 [Micromonospora sonchi]